MGPLGADLVPHTGFCAQRPTRPSVGTVGGKSHRGTPGAAAIRVQIRAQDRRRLAAEQRTDQRPPGNRWQERIAISGLRMTTLAGGHDGPGGAGGDARLRAGDGPHALAYLLKQPTWCIRAPVPPTVGERRHAGWGRQFRSAPSPGSCGRPGQAGHCAGEETRERDHQARPVAEDQARSGICPRRARP